MWGRGGGRGGGRRGGGIIASVSLQYPQAAENSLCG